MHALRICQTLDKLNEDAWSSLMEKELTASAHPRRKETYLFAREALRLALCDLGYLPQISELTLRHHHQLPHFPKVTVSLSHTPGTGVALVGYRQNYLSLGVDIERSDRMVKPEILARVSHPQDANLRNIEIWCLKEAVFKCLCNSERLNQEPLFTEIQITEGGWSHSPSGLAGKWELRHDGPYLLALTSLPA